MHFIFSHLMSRQMIGATNLRSAVKTLAILLAVSVVMAAVIYAISFEARAYDGTQITQIDPPPPGCPEVDGKAFVLYDAQSGTILAGHHANEPLPPASITKVMTALLALENLELSDPITITAEMFETIPNDYTRLGLMEGEIITVEQALHASLMISANDAAMALGLTVGGTLAGFIDMMNVRARELGCTDTQFTNPYGYADEAHLTTACDMALITAEALKYPLFSEITTKKNHLLEPTNLFAESRGLPNGNRFVTSSEFAYDAYIGGKTGYTDLSRYTIVAGAGKDGRTLVGVILGASNSPIRYSNLIDLFEYGFSQTVTQSIDPTEYESLKQQAVDQLKAQIDDADYALYVADAKLQLDDCITVTRVNEAGGHTVGMDCNPELLQADLEQQILNFPLYRRYNDGNEVQVGLLEVTVLKLQPTPTPTAAATSIAPSSDPAADAGTGGPTILRYLLIGLAGIVFVFAILLLIAMVKRDLSRRRRGRPRML